VVSVGETRTPRGCARVVGASRWLIAEIFFRQMADQYRQLGEIAGNSEIKQRMLDMAAMY
jgi:hypothetical protein